MVMVRIRRPSPHGGADIVADRDLGPGSYTRPRFSSHSTIQADRVNSERKPKRPGDGLGQHIGPRIMPPR
jgi:hypothetical protein